MVKSWKLKMNHLKMMLRSSSRRNAFTLVTERPSLWSADYAVKARPQLINWLLTLPIVTPLKNPSGAPNAKLDTKLTMGFKTITVRITVKKDIFAQCVATAHTVLST